MDVIDRTLRASVGLFVVAGLTGALFRMAAAYGWTLGLDPVNVRHAHSHLMVFGWAVPAVFALIGSAVVRSGGCAPSRRLMAAVLALAVTAWGSFLAWGYGSAPLGEARIPVSVIVSTLAMFTWYGFGAWYRRERVHLAAGGSRTFMDLGVLLLLASTLGAWGVAATVPAGDSLPALKTAFAHLFLALFSEGWLVLALLGLAWSRLPGSTGVPRWAIRLLLAGLSVSFLLGMPGILLDDNTRLVARIGGMAWGAGAVGIAWAWWKAAPAGARRSWGPAMLLLATKGSAQAASMLVPTIWWADIAPMRVLYLHVLLLGFVTTGIAAMLVGGRRLMGFQAAVLALILVLVPMTDLWPRALAPDRPMAVAAWVSFLMPLVSPVLFRRRYVNRARP